MTHRTDPASDAERGTTTAEYAVGTVGACSIAVVLHELATDGFWYDQLVELIRYALQWRPLVPDGVPLPRIRLR